MIHVHGMGVPENVLNIVNTRTQYRDTRDLLGMTEDVLPPKRCKCPGEDSHTCRTPFVYVLSRESTKVASRNMDAAIRAMNEANPDPLLQIESTGLHRLLNGKMKKSRTHKGVFVERMDPVDFSSASRFSDFVLV